MDEKNQYPGFLTVASASETLGLTSQAVRGLLAKGVLAGQRVGRIWIIPSESVEKLVVERGINSPQSSQKTKKHVSKGAKLRALSFFSGAMGLDLGLERSGVETILACENDKWSRRTIEANRPDLPLLGNIWEHDRGKRSEKHWTFSQREY